MLRSREMAAPSAPGRRAARWPRLAFGMLVLATGCASLVEYQAPPGPKAHVTLVGRGPLVTVVDERDCTRPPAKLANLRADFLSLDMGDRITETDIEADRWMGLDVGYANCPLKMRFKPRAGERYEVRMDLIGPYCRFHVVHLVPAADGTFQRVPEPTAEKVDHFCGR